MKKSDFQQIIENGAFMLVIIFGIFAGIDGLSSSTDFLTIRVSGIVSCVVIVVSMIIFFYLKRFAVNWVEEEKLYKFIGLRKKFFLLILAILGALWIPHLFKENKSSFSVRVKLSTPYLPQYPKLESPIVRFWFNNSWLLAKVVSDKVAIFEQVDYQLRDKKVKVEMQAKWWKLISDTLILNPETQLKIEPDGSLGSLTGKVHNIDGNIPLDGAMLEVDGEKDTTDLNGNFTVILPTEKQKEQYILTVIKNGYELKQQTVYPASSRIEIRLRKSQN